MLVLLRLQNVAWFFGTGLVNLQEGWHWQCRWAKIQRVTIYMEATGQFGIFRFLSCWICWLTYQVFLENVWVLIWGWEHACKVLWNVCTQFILQLRCLQVKLPAVFHCYNQLPRLKIKTFWFIFHSFLITFKHLVDPFIQRNIHLKVGIFSFCLFVSIVWASGKHAAVLFYTFKFKSSLFL